MNIKITKNLLYFKLKGKHFKKLWGEGKNPPARRFIWAYSLNLKFIWYFYQIMSD